MLGYNTLLPQEKEQMLKEIGVSSIDELFAMIPKELLLNRPLNIPKQLSEWEVEKKLETLANKNLSTKTHLNFIGSSSYEHYIPAVVDTIANRGEFLTSYTPYQPEMSQGLLQCLYEYQQALSAITGLPVVNGSCYDGATALADGAKASCIIAGRQSILVAESIWKQYREVINTYMYGGDIEIHPVAHDPLTGRINLEDLKNKIIKIRPSGFLFQSPNMFGVLEDIAAITNICQTNKVISVLSMNPLLSGLFTPPGKLGVDIVTCEGQPLGLPLNAGGPTLGIFSTKNEYKKYVPGRLVGKVTDIRGALAYALVYEDREQHIAREMATSNICSNQALNAVRAIVYLAAVGEQGYAKIAELNSSKAHYLANKLTQIPGVSLMFSGHFFNEFALKLPVPAAQIIEKLLKDSIFAGFDMSRVHQEFAHVLVIAVTELKTRAELDQMALAMRNAIIQDISSCN